MSDNGKSPTPHLPPLPKRTEADRQSDAFFIHLSETNRRDAEIRRKREKAR